VEQNEHHPDPGVPKAELGHLRTGVYVLAALIALTVIEYFIALAMTTKNLPVMLAMNVADAAIIMYFFMHVMRAFRGGH
jgi:heme/copper-type cytochrome/quinol oxidase subunit 4